MPTSNYAWPFPGPSSTVDVPRDIQALAEAIDATAKTHLNPPTVQARQTVAQSIASGAQPPLLLDTEDYDTHAMHSTSSGTSRLTCVVAGVYLLWGTISFAANATGRRIPLIFKNGAAIAQHMHANTGSVPWTGPAPTVTVRLVVNDYVELVASHEAGVNLSTNVLSIYTQPMFGALWIAP